MNTILEAKKLNKVYEMGKENKQHVLKDVDLKIERGEFITVMGQSGSGKSTLLYNVSGMDRFTAGSVSFEGQELDDKKEEELARIRLSRMGFIFQQGGLLKNLNILDNIILAPYLKKKESRHAIRKRAKQLMKGMGIEQIADHDITQVSGGQLQRAAICRALMNGPEILFGDEPTGALNSSATKEVMDFLADVNAAGTTIMLVTHDAKVAAKSERVLFMTDGNITAEKYLGKYNPENSNIQSREEELASWLSEQGF